MATRLTWINNWFKTEAKPTAAQFADVLTRLFKKDEDTLPIASVENLSVVLAAKADKSELQALGMMSKTLPAGTESWEVPAGTLIEKFLIIAPTGLLAFKIGTTDGGQEIIDPYEIAAGYSTYQKDVFFSVATTIYFGGIAGDTVIKILTR